MRYLLLSEAYSLLMERFFASGLLLDVHYRVALGLHDADVCLLSSIYL